jgi:hypothetical protein
VRYRRLSPFVVIRVVATALFFGQAALHAAVDLRAAADSSNWGMSVQYNASEQVRDQSGIFTQPAGRP